MKFTALLSSTILLASSTTVLAAPKGAMGHGLKARVAARTNRSSNPMVKISTGETEGTPSGTKTEIDYSGNWAGAVIEEPPSGTFTAVAATFTVPTPSIPSGSSRVKRSADAETTYAASAWVGIDGDTYQNAILQTGIDFYVTSSGDVSFDSWYEWYPDYAYDFGLDVSAGDVIALSVTSSSSTSGTAVLENVSTGQSVSKTLSAPESSASLGGQNAEWIVEDFDENNSEVPFADFGTVVFTDASATTSSGDTVDASGATVIDIEQDNDVLTSVTISGSEVSVSYD